MGGLHETQGSVVHKPSGSDKLIPAATTNSSKFSLIARIGKQLKKKLRANKQELEKERNQYMSI